MNKKISILYILAVVAIVSSTALFPNRVSAGTATIRWNANTESDLAGYKVYYGTSPRTGTDPKSCTLCGYSTVVNVGNVTSYIFNNLTDGLTYYFSVSSYDTSGNESAFSNPEVSKLIPAPTDTTPPALSNGSPTGVLSAGTTQTTLSVSTNESATCKYSTAAGVDYSSMANTFTTTGGTNHSVTITGLSNGQPYNYYVKCRDFSSNANTSNDYPISFSVASSDSAITANFYSSASDGSIWSSTQSAWSSARDAATGQGFSSSASDMDVRVSYKPSYQLWRGFLYFDTSSLPDNAVIQSAILHLYPAMARADDNDVQAYVGLVQGLQSATLSASDFSKLGTALGAGKVNISSLSTSGYNSFALTSTGLSWINKTGTTQLGLREGHDIENSAMNVATYNITTFYTSDKTGTAQDPYLEVVYTFATDNLLPTTPTNLSANNPTSPSQINLSWNASTDDHGVVGYKIYRCTGSSCSPTTQITTSLTTSYSDTGLSASTAYTYAVSAYDAAGNTSVPSPVASATTQSSSAPICTFFTYSAWAPTTCPSSQTQNRTVISSLPDGCTGGNPIITQSCTYVPPPSTKFVAGDRIQVSSGPLNVRATASLTGTLLGTEATGALGTVAGGPTASGGYSWWNVSFDNALTGWSVEDYLVKYTAPPSAPTITLSAFPTSVTSGGSTTLTWGSTSATSCTAGGGWTGTKATSGTQSFTNLTIATTYTLSCTGTGGTVAQDATVTVTAASDTTAPSVPANLVATTISSSQINLSWSASTDSIVAGQATSGVSGYRIYRNGILFTTTTGTSYSSIGLSAGTLYSYMVSAYDVSGNNSTQSIAATATTLLAADVTAPIVSLSAPSTGATVSGTVTVSAIASDPTVTGYSTSGVAGVQFKLDGVNLGVEDTIAPYAISWNTTTVTNGSHTLTAVARDAAGDVTTSSASTVTVSNTTPPPPDITAPTLLTISVGSLTSTSAIINWTTNELATSLTTYGTSSTLLDKQVYDPSPLLSHSLAIVNLKRRTTYSYRASSADTSNNTATSPLFSFTTLNGKPSKIKGLTVTGGSIILAWDALPQNDFITQIVIYRSTANYPTNADTPSLLATLTDPNTSLYHDQAVTSGITYYYTIYAVDDLGVYSDPTQISFTTQAQAAVTGSTGSTGSTNAPSSGLTSEQIQAILSLLISFDADQSVIDNVRITLNGGTPVLTGTTSAPACSFTKDLTLKSSGSDVTCLQKALIAGGYSIPAGATGYFGNQTKAAVSMWQTAVGVSPTAGYFGSISRARWNLGTH